MTRKRYRAVEIIGHLQIIEIKRIEGSGLPRYAGSRGIMEWTFYRWKKEYGELRVNQAKRLKGPLRKYDCPHQDRLFFSPSGIDAQIVRPHKNTTIATKV